jgi:hypothetical protein
VSVALNRTARRLFARFREPPVTLAVTLTNGAAGPTVVADGSLLIMSLNPARIAHAIERAIFYQRRIRAKVTCPAAMIQAKGGSFTCIATTTVGRGTHKERVRTPFECTVANDERYFLFES